MKKRILIVEDNITAFKVSKMFFEMKECEVEHAETGEQALELFVKHAHEENHYDAICMDIGLPKMSGTEACIAIREYEAKNHLDPVPIVAVTGNNSSEETKRYMAAGMQHALDKPFTPQKAEIFLSFCK